MQSLILDCDLDKLTLQCPVCGKLARIMYWSVRLPPTAHILCETCGRYRYVRLDPRGRGLDLDMEDAINDAESHTSHLDALEKEAALDNGR